MDWDDAYANIANIPGGEEFPAMWLERSAGFRDGFSSDRMRRNVSYGPHQRELMDVFLPEAAPNGIAVFVHGGYWLKFDQSVFSHLAGGVLDHGWAVVMPGYPLAPDVRVSSITRSIARAVIRIAEDYSGPIRLAGHSAGGHLVTRQICVDTTLPPNVTERIAGVLSISGVHDLRPMLKLAMNAELHLDMDEAARESPALHAPLEGFDVHAWVGDDERPEFVRQTTLLANIWAGFDMTMRQTIETDRHHLDVISGLDAPNSGITKAFVGL